MSRCTNEVPQCMGRVNFGECHCRSTMVSRARRDGIVHQGGDGLGATSLGSGAGFDSQSSRLSDWVDIIPADKDAASVYWGNDNPPLEMQAAFASHRRATEQRLEEQFWTVVDSSGLASVPSDMFAALEALTRSAKRSAKAEAELLEALTGLVLFHDVPEAAQDPVAVPLIRSALSAIAKARGSA